MCEDYQNDEKQYLEEVVLESTGHGLIDIRVFSQGILLSQATSSSFPLDINLLYSVVLAAHSHTFVVAVAVVVLFVTLLLGRQICIIDAHLSEGGKHSFSRLGSLKSSLKGSLLLRTPSAQFPGL